MIIKTESSSEYDVTVYKFAGRFTWGLSVERSSTRI